MLGEGNPHVFFSQPAPGEKRQLHSSTNDSPELARPACFASLTCVCNLKGGEKTSSGRMGGGSFLPTPDLIPGMEEGSRKVLGRVNLLIKKSVGGSDPWILEGKVTYDNGGDATHSPHFFLFSFSN